MRKVASIGMSIVILFVATTILVGGLTADPPADPWWPCNGSSSASYSMSVQTFYFNETAIYNWDEWIDGWSSMCILDSRYTFS